MIYPLKCLFQKHYQIKSHKNDNVSQLHILTATSSDTEHITALCMHGMAWCGLTASIFYVTCSNKTKKNTSATKTLTFIASIADHLFGRPSRTSRVLPPSTRKWINLTTELIYTMLRFQGLLLFDFPFCGNVAGVGFFIVLFSTLRVRVLLDLVVSVFR